MMEGLTMPPSHCGQKSGRLRARTCAVGFKAILLSSAIFDLPGFWPRSHSERPLPQSGFALLIPLELMNVYSRWS